MEEQFLRRKQIEGLIGLARSIIYDRIKADTFQKPVKIDGRAVAWLQSDIDAYQNDRIAKGQAKCSIFPYTPPALQK